MACEENSSVERAKIMDATPDSTQYPSYSAGFMGVLERFEGTIWSVTGMNVIAGTVSGIAGVFAGHPFDTIKVRLQSQPHPSSGVVKYKNTWHCFTSILREERIRGLFKGVSSPLVGVTAINTLLFGVYGYLLELQMSHDVNRELNLRDGESLKSPMEPDIRQIFVAGAGSGLLNSFISGPIELAKIQLQNQIADSKDSFRGPTDCLRQVYKSKGLTGVYKGFFMTVARETPSYGVYFATFEALRRYWSWKGVSEGEEPIGLSNSGLMLAGGLSGIAAWVSNYPVDVIKTRLQAQPIMRPPSIGYLVHQDTSSMGAWACTKHIIKAEGVPGLFRGLTATLIRAFPTNAVIFTSYALTMRWLETVRPSNIKEDLG